MAAPVTAGLASGVGLLVLFAVWVGPAANIAPGATGAMDNAISVVMIPEGAASQSGKNFEPSTIKVVIGVNSTVKWINNDEVMSAVIADNPNEDPDFAAAAPSPTDVPRLKQANNILEPGEDFEYTFTRPGEVYYHSEPHPWLRGTVVAVLPPSAKESPVSLANEKESCMSVDRIESTLAFDFKTPSYLPVGYRYACGRADSGEAIVAYWDKPIDWNEFNKDNIGFAQLHKGSILQMMVREPQITNGIAAIMGDYNHILEVNPSLKPQLVDIGNGKVAWANAIAGDAARQTAEFATGETITITSSMPSRLRTYYDDGYSLHLEGYVPLDELVRIAKSMQ